jgi:hypothetical protein
MVGERLPNSLIRFEDAARRAPASVVGRLFLRSVALSLVGGFNQSAAQGPLPRLSAPTITIDSKTVTVVPVHHVSERVSREITDDVKIENIEDVTRVVISSASTALLLGSRPPRVVLVGLSDARSSRFGRVGGGPGEFRRVTDVDVIGDTIITLDPSLGRISLFQAATGKYLWSRQVALKRFNSIAGVLRTGSIVLHDAGIFLDRTATPVRRTLAHVTVVPRVGDPREIVTLPDLYLRPTEIRLHGRRETIHTPERLGPTAAVIVVDESIIATSSERLGFSVFDGNGRLVRTVVVSKPLRAVTPRMKGIAVQAELDQFRNSTEPLPNRSEYERLVIRAAPYRDSLPAIHSMHRSHSGVVWLVEGIAPGDVGWSAVGFRTTGEVVARIHSVIPGAPMAIDDELVVTREENADGAAVLRVRMFQSAGAARR